MWFILSLKCMKEENLEQRKQRWNNYFKIFPKSKHVFKRLFFILNYFWAHRMLRKNPVVPQKSGHKTHIPMITTRSLQGFLVEQLLWSFWYQKLREFTWGGSEVFVSWKLINLSRKAERKYCMWWVKLICSYMRPFYEVGDQR